MHRRILLLSLIGSLFSRLLSAGQKRFAFKVTERDLSGFVVTDRPSSPARPVSDVTSPPDGAVTERGWVNVYVNRTGCPACERFKSWLRSQKDLPCEFRLREFNHPSWLLAVPSFHWNVGNKSYLEYGWSGPDGFFPKYEGTLKEK